MFVQLTICEETLKIQNRQYTWSIMVKGVTTLSDLKESFDQLTVASLNNWIKTVVRVKPRMGNYPINHTIHYTNI
jgi:hypothetical protein